MLTIQQNERKVSFNIFFGVPHLATCISCNNEPELGAGINPGMPLTPLPSSIGQGSNPGPLDRVPSALQLDHSFRFNYLLSFLHEMYWLC